MWGRNDSRAAAPGHLDGWGLAHTQGGANGRRNHYYGHLVSDIIATPLESQGPHARHASAHRELELSGGAGEADTAGHTRVGLSMRHLPHAPKRLEGGSVRWSSSRRAWPLHLLPISTQIRSRTWSRRLSSRPSPPSARPARRLRGGWPSSKAPAARLRNARGGGRRESRATAHPPREGERGLVRAREGMGSRAPVMSNSSRM